MAGDRSTAVVLAERGAVTAGGVTSVAGVLLTAAPQRSARLIGLGDHPALVRAVGISDLLVAPGLLRGRPRWPWLTARAALNVCLVAGAVRYRESLGGKAAALGAGAFTVLSAVDGAGAAVLRSAGR